MSFASRRFAPAALTTALLAGSCLAATPAAAFKVAESTDFKGCAVWTNDAGEPLRNRQGREIARKAPCGEGTHNRDAYEVLFGEAAGTLVFRDATQEFECILELAPGSSTVMVQKICQRWTGG
ncbi:hypothetical protein D3273_04345 [Lichenibacterium minor]|uniref:Uncharacterized protein n=1 Tax=Lichenibacterium minor TaxID=2316528 RepID=A0A4Q2U9H5_9HYPH|nr:hypothetical protein [Lichenibacterium minor]RYC33112.1 hypothetical protein D3273_04345 [Lichenibacterium minor]